MHSVRSSIPAVMYQIPDTAGMSTEIYIPTHKVGLNVFGEIFRSEQSRYTTNTVFNYEGFEFRLGDLYHSRVSVEWSIAEKLLFLAKKDRLELTDTTFLSELILHTFPEKVQPDSMVMAKFHEVRFKKKSALVKTSVSP